MPHVILSGFGEHRARATIAAVRATDARTLVADEPLARAIIALHPGTQSAHK